MASKAKTAVLILLVIIILGIVAVIVLQSMGIINLTGLKATAPTTAPASVTTAPASMTTAPAGTNPTTPAPLVASAAGSSVTGAPVTAAPATTAPVTSAPVISTVYSYPGWDAAGNDIASWPVSKFPYATLTAAAAAYPQMVGWVNDGQTIWLKSGLATPNTQPVTKYLAVFKPLTLPGQLQVFSAGGINPAKFSPLALTSQPLKWAGNPSGNYTRYLDCDGGACTKNPNKVQIWQGSGAPGQQWTWNNGGVTSGGRCLATVDNGRTDGTRVVAHPGAGGTGGQEWVWTAPASGAGWLLKNPLSGKCLDVAGNVDADGSVMQLWSCDTTGSRWQPVPFGQ